ncbi:hypothetical protein AGDE_15969 [Angomonas deanei]|uniref:Uncharacterized protein n=1 Tax=Angomonas deanei TaxID=59799 RepID=A0A7G2CUQ0_9TRYP|nr:hypothetical protein AGDE_15969 [Angomonas deanei]CAD2222791.1 hypothetical protein, conserved [Angomonas deanei]|eukprot:EPY18005.1 hypothetical protein AGDE_15969 [Angomonas deanei]
MSSGVQNLQYAAQLMEQAREEEREDGNPLSASRFYLTAIELVMSTATEVARQIPDEAQRKFFLFQVKSKISVYQERVSLLLQVARESGLIDKATVTGGGGPASAALPPPLYQTGDNKNNNTNGSAVVGIPMNSDSLPQTSGGYGNQNNNRYLPAGTEAPPPADLDMDDLLRQLDQLKK